MGNARLTSIWAAGLGAGLMLVLDPARGRRRRALMRDKLVHGLHKSRDAVGATGRDLGHRAVGTVATARARLTHDTADDAKIVQRVRAALGRAVSHPSAIVVSSSDRHLTLEGPILTHEVDQLLATVRGVRGVKSIDSRLEAHTRAEDVPSLQGGVDRHPQRSELMQGNWSPTTRLVAGMTGVGLVAWGLGRRSWLGAASIAGGAGLVARALTNLENQRLFGLHGHRGVDIQKTIHIAAPVAEVYRRWREYENFPYFMSHVREVRHISDGRSLWTVDGPGGVPVRWGAEITREIPEQLLAWKTLPGSAIRHAGVVRFEPESPNGTRVTVHLSYNPPAGALAHGLAALLGADPKQRMDEDLVRMKRFIEEGKPPHDAARRDRPRSVEAGPENVATRREDVVKKGGVAASDADAEGVSRDTYGDNVGPGHVH